MDKGQVPIYMYVLLVILILFGVWMIIKSAGGIGAIAAQLWGG